MCHLGCNGCAGCNRDPRLEGYCIGLSDLVPGLSE